MGGNAKNNLFSFRDNTLLDPQNARLVSAGPLVTVPGGYPMVPWGSSSGFEGADIIKIALDSGGSFNRTIPMLSKEEAEAVVDVTHSRGTLVSAHVLVSKDLAFALEAGVDDIAHMVTDNLKEK